MSIVHNVETSRRPPARQAAPATARARRVVRVVRQRVKLLLQHPKGVLRSNLHSYQSPATTPTTVPG
jgi:hypothetical protein